MASVFKRAADKKRRDRPYYIAYTDESGRRRTIKGCTDRAATGEIARQLEQDVQLRKRGVKERCAEQGHRLFLDHIREYTAHLQAEGGHVERYLQQVSARLKAFGAFSEIETLVELDADRVVAFVRSLRKRELADATVNEYVGTLKAFTKWAVRTSRLPSDPLSVVRKQSAKTTERKRPRRSLTADEIGVMLQAAVERPLHELATIRHGPRRGQRVARVGGAARARALAKGRERVVAYLLALWTGLRRSELHALEWRDVQLDTLPARLTLRKLTTKAKRADTVALHPQIAEALRAMRRADSTRTDRVLGVVPGMKVLKADLAYAGV